MEYDEKTLREYLVDLYWKEQKSLTIISKELGIPLRTLAVIFEECGIRTRSRKKGVKLWWKQRKLKW